LKIVDGDALGYPYLRGHRQDALHQANQGIDALLPCQEKWILLGMQGIEEMRRLGYEAVCEHRRAVLLCACELLAQHSAADHRPPPTRSMLEEPAYNAVAFAVGHGQNLVQDVRTKCDQ